MSAIYGSVDLTGGKISDNFAINFKKYYSKYAIDRLEEVISGNVVMGCGIQYFNREAERETLPVYDEEAGVYFTADCVIDNRTELCTELGLNTDTPDGKIALEAYKKWNTDAFVKLKGPWSLAIYDKANNEVILATDHLAQRCLMYHKRGNRVYFSTLFLPIIHETGLEFNENERWLVDEISLRSPVMITEPRETAVLDVYKVVSGTYVKINLNNVTETRYYDPINTFIIDRSITPEKSEEIVRDTMRRIMANMLRPGVKYGCQLSQGLDSTSAACTAAPILKEWGENLYSYTSVPIKEANLPNTGYLVFDETEGVKKLCETYPNIIPTFVDSAGRNYLKEVDDIISIWEMPCKSQQNAIWIDEILRKAQADGVRIMLNGGTGNCTISTGDTADVVYYYATHLKLKKLGETFKNLKKMGVLRKKYVKRLIGSTVEYYKWYFDSKAKDCYLNTFTRRDFGEKYKLTKRFHKEFTHFYPFKGERKYREQMYMQKANAQIGEIHTGQSLKYGVLMRDPTSTTDLVEMCFSMGLECFAYTDYDRRLVRIGMEGIVPEYIRLDVRHRGRQSGDNEYRTSVVWDEMLPTIRENLYTEDVLKYLDADKIDAYINKLNKDNICDSMMDMRMVVDAYSFARFLKLIKKH